MLTYLLAADPTTPADVLTYLTTRPLTPTDSDALAANPTLPDGTHLPLPARNGAGLHIPLSNPRTPTHLRQRFIDAATVPELVRDIATHDDFTADELDRIYATHADTLDAEPWGDLLSALAHNPHTPPHLAATLVGGLRLTGHPLLADVTALRHHLPPDSSGAQAAAARPGPVGAYARHLLLTHPAPGTPWWAATIAAFPHPLITAAALRDAGTGRPGTRARSGAICRAVARSARAAPAHRYRAAQLSTHAIPFIANFAPAHVLRALARDGHPSGWHNVHATDATLRATYRHARANGGPVPPHILAAIALHPGASTALRRDMATEAAGSSDPWLTAIVAHLTGDRGELLDCRYSDLLLAEDFTEHFYHWARPAWARHHRTAPVTLAYAHALLTLEGAEFSGTLRELLTTARTVAT